jgi:hypothetical protein
MPERDGDKLTKLQLQRISPLCLPLRQQGVVRDY